MNSIPILLCLALANLSIPTGGLACLAASFPVAQNHRANGHEIEFVCLGVRMPQVFTHQKAVALRIYSQPIQHPTSPAAKTPKIAG